MGTHALDLHLIKNFAVREPPEFRNLWHLGANDRRPRVGPITRFAKFQLDCSTDVDRHIRAVQNRASIQMFEVLGGRTPEFADWQATIDCLAVHYVRSRVLEAQLESEMQRLVDEGSITGRLADFEYTRLASHQDLATFQGLCDCAAATFSNLVSMLAVPARGHSFITSDALIHAMPNAGEVFPGIGLLVWFPMGPRVGMFMCGEEHLVPVVRLEVFGGKSGSIRPRGPERDPGIRQSPMEPLDVDAESADTLNCLMALTSRRLFARDRQAIDAALARAADFETIPVPFRYRPAAY
ncbi:MAG: hypothetical protein OXP37_02765 [Chloroflexota bacterium]|nr:hypothetical protein [Chloroflexota bacterium]MDE2935742.1 hypothetical protein [Chloroflexota bacterium]